MSRLAALAYRTESLVRDGVASVAARAGWTPAVLPYPGYGQGHRVRVLGRVLLAPAGTDPAARRGLPGWRRFLTLESPGTEVDVEVAGARATVRSDRSGLVDAVLEVGRTQDGEDHPLGPGVVTAVLSAGGRRAQAPVHVAAADARTGVVCDVDDTVLVTDLAHPLHAAWLTLARSFRDRRAVPGMAGLLRDVVAEHPGAPVVYLSNGAWNLAGPLVRFLGRNDYPAGALLMTDWGFTPRGWFRDGRAHKSGSIARLAADLPDVRWVLVGDTGEEDPDVYAQTVQERPEHVRAVVLREVNESRASRGAGTGRPLGDAETGGAVPLVRGPDGAALGRLLRQVGVLASGR